mmetsp:Transcript_14600/g.29401  ORF Transcript_14600/g.29401 Transcript_14600/m.29401 type:complete len:281 (+) Transcript_14600:1573-2415(+)
MLQTSFKNAQTQSQRAQLCGSCPSWFTPTPHCRKYSTLPSRGRWEWLHTRWKEGGAPLMECKFVQKKNKLQKSFWSLRGRRLEVEEQKTGRKIGANFLAKKISYLFSNRFGAPSICLYIRESFLLNCIKTKERLFVALCATLERSRFCLFPFSQQAIQPAGGGSRYAHAHTEGERRMKREKSEVRARNLAESDEKKKSFGAGLLSRGEQIMENKVKRMKKRSQQNHACTIDPHRYSATQLMLLSLYLLVLFCNTIVECPGTFSLCRCSFCSHAGSVFGFF